MDTKIKMQFDPAIAKKVGTDAAIIYANIEFWIYKNLTDYQSDLKRMDRQDARNKNNIIDNRAWTYNSHKAWTRFFPYLSESQIKRNLQKLVESNLIIVSQHNRASYDRTNWYTLSDEKYLIDETISSNLADDVVSPIPDNKPDNKQNFTKVKLRAKPLGFGDNQINGIINKRKLLKWSLDSKERFVAKRLIKSEGYASIIKLMGDYEDNRSEPFMPQVNTLKDFEKKLPTIKNKLEEVVYEQRPL